MKKIAIEAAYMPHPGDTAIIDGGRVEVMDVTQSNGEFQFLIQGPGGPQWLPISRIKRLIPPGYPG